MNVKCYMITICHEAAKVSYHESFVPYGNSLYSQKIITNITLGTWHIFGLRRLYKVYFSPRVYMTPAFIWINMVIKYVLKSLILNHQTKIMWSQVMATNLNYNDKVLVENE